MFRWLLKFKKEREERPPKPPDKARPVCTGRRLASYGKEEKEKKGRKRTGKNKRRKKSKGNQQLNKTLNKILSKLAKHDEWVRNSLKQEIATQIVEMELFKKMVTDIKNILGQQFDNAYTKLDSQTDVSTGQYIAARMTEIRQILKRLSARQRTLIFTLAQMKGQYISYKEIALKLGLTPSTVRDIMNAVIKKGVPVKSVNEFGKKFFAVPADYESIILGNTKTLLKENKQKVLVK